MMWHKQKCTSEAHYMLTRLNRMRSELHNMPRLVDYFYATVFCHFRALKNYIIEEIELRVFISLNRIAEQ